HQRGCFAEALAQPDDLERLARFAHRLELAASIPIAVEDVDHLITRAARIEPLSVLAMQRRKIVHALTHAHDDRKIRSSHDRGPSCSPAGPRSSNRPAPCPLTPDTAAATAAAVTIEKRWSLASPVL